MDDAFLQHLRDAWERLKPRLQRDPDELRRRLGRRRGKMMQRPPRAWCLAVRASDWRISPASAIVTPEWAAWKSRCIGQPFRPRRHRVVLDATLLRRLCGPVDMPFPAVDVRTAARLLGRSTGNMTALLRSQTFSQRRAPLRRGRLTTLVFTRAFLDASARGATHQDILWGTQWRYLSERVPDDLAQEVERIPLWMDQRTRDAGRTKAVMFRGWKWVCPGCAQTCRTLFYPLPPVYGVQLLRRERPGDDPDALAPPAPSFACARCHDVLYFRRFNAAAWNHLVSHLSGGLLYGREVKRPAGIEFVRTKKFRPTLGLRPSRRRAEVLEALRAGLSYAQVALKLGVTRSTIHTHARVIYRQMGVTDKAEAERRWGVVRRTNRNVVRASSSARADVSLGTQAGNGDAKSATVTNATTTSATTTSAATTSAATTSALA